MKCQILHESDCRIRISTMLSECLKQDYQTITGVSSALILPGVFGIIRPAMTACLHNSAALMLSLYSMTDCRIPAQIKEAALPAG